MFVIPMRESERGWGSKIDGYASPNKYSWDYKIFADDFPQASRDIVVGRAMSDINGTVFTPNPHTFNWTAPA